jgi:glycerol-3-phosphate dehydrogenase
VVAFVIRFYGRLAGKSVLPKAKILSPIEVEQHLPGINKKHLKGGVLYWDGWTNDALLTIHALKDAAAKGAVVQNYCEAKKFNRVGDNIISISCVDKISNQTVVINAKWFINATGVWTDDILNLTETHTHKTMKPSKGVHIVVSNKRIASANVAIVESGTSDKRYLYSFPWEHNLTVLGNTDTEYTDSADKIETTEEDVNYILNAFNKSFPEANLTKKDIVSVYAGLRPMLNDETDKSTYSRSREYRIWWSGSNLLNIAGGKLTSFLSMGERCMDVAEERFPRINNKASNVSSTVINLSEAMYQILEEDAALSKPIISGLKVTGADVMFHTRYLFAQQVEDVLTRRTAVTYALKEFDETAVRETARIMAKELKKDESWINEQVSEYRKHWNEYHPDFLNC